MVAHLAVLTVAGRVEHWVGSRAVKSVGEKGEMKAVE
jgi:hypothetical protein